MNKKRIDTGIASLDEDPTSQTSLINDKTNEVNEANLFYTKYNKTHAATAAKTDSPVYSLYAGGQHLEATHLYQCQSEYDKVHAFSGANYYNTSLLHDENENNMSNTYPSNVSTGQAGLLLNSSNNSYYYQSNGNDTLSVSANSTNKELEAPDYHQSYNFNHHNHQPNVNYLLIN